MITNSPADDIKDILVAQNPTAYVFGTNLFIGYVPETPDRCMAILDSGGYSSDVTSDFERPSVQLRSRGNPSNYAQVRQDLAGIITILHGNRITINDVEYTFIKQGDITFIGRDENDRTEMVCEMNINRINA